MQISWNMLLSEIGACTCCELHQTRTNTVPGEGDPNADLMFIGEGPGKDEDLKGRPFVGRAGQLLDKMIAAMGLSRGQVYICNVVKCRPPNNRVPNELEANACMPYLRRQFQLVRPKVIVLLGATASKYIWDPNIRITKDHGKWENKKGIWMMPTFHPAALLRNPTFKKDAWEDLQSVMNKLAELAEA